MVTAPSNPPVRFGHDLDMIVHHCGAGQDIGRRFPAVA